MEQAATIIQAGIKGMLVRQSLRGKMDQDKPPDERRDDDDDYNK